MCMNCSMLWPEGAVRCPMCRGPVYGANWWTIDLLQSLYGQALFPQCSCGVVAKMSRADLEARFQSCSHEFRRMERADEEPGDSGTIRIWWKANICDKCGYGERVFEA